MALLDHRHGHPISHRALGMATRRAPRDHQLLRPGRSGGDEQARGHAFVNGLDAGQRAKAILRATKTGNDKLTEAWKDNVVLDYAGVRAAEMTANLRHLAATPDLPNREHVHVVVRTPNGNDYGKDLLRQHYAQHAHSGY